MYMIGAVVTGVFGFVYFGLLNTGVATIIFLAIVVSLVPHDMMYGPQAALIAESFTGRLRYSGSSLGYQLASVIAGGPAPLIATWLFGTLSQLICDRPLYRGVRGAQPHRNRADDRLHRQRHRGRICDVSCVASGFNGIRRFKSVDNPGVHGAARSGVTFASSSF